MDRACETCAIDCGAEIISSNEVRDQWFLGMYVGAAPENSQ